MQQSTLQQLRDTNNGKVPAYAWPGGYPMYYVMTDGEPLCPSCVNDPSNPVHDGGDADGWQYAGCEVNWEDPDLYCAHCNKRIESAYAEPETEPEPDALTAAQSRMDAEDDCKTPPPMGEDDMERDRR